MLYCQTWSKKYSVELLKDTSGKAVDDGTAFCKSCNKAVIARNGNTSNLRSHLKNNHRLLFSQLAGCGSQAANPNPKPQQQSQLNTFMKSQPPYSHQSKRWKELNNAVAWFLCKDGLPLYTVEKEGFKKLIQTMDNRYELPNRTHFSRHIIPELYTSTKEKVTMKLTDVQFFAATTDIWSSIGMTPYISYTIHYISKEWDLESPLLFPLAFSLKTIQLQ